MAIRLSTGIRNKMLGINTEMITNGGFTTDYTGWTASNATLSSAGSGQSGNCLSIAETGSSNPGQAYQDVTTIIGRLYKLVLYFKKGTADAGAFFIGTTGSYNSIYSSGTIADAAWAKYTVYFIATATTTRITLQSTDATAAETSFFDSVSLVDYAHTLQQIFNLGFVDIYTGIQPASANTAPSGTLLATISNASAGVTFDDATGGVISKASTETWSGTCGNAGTAGWGRLRSAGDLGTTNSTDERVDGAVATSGAEFNFATGVSWALGSIQVLTSFTITIPTA